MKHKLKAVIAAVALSIGAGAASAAIVQPSTGDGEMFLTVWDSVANVSYTRQLEINLGAFTGTSNLSFAGDSLFASTFAGSSASNIMWNVVAGDNTPGSNQNTNGNLRLLTTSTNTVGSGISLTNAGLNAASNNTNTFVSALNAMGCDLNPSCATSDPSDAGFGGGGGWGPSFGNVGNVSNAGGGFGSLNFWYLTGGGGTIATQVSKTRFNALDGVNPAVWTLGTDGGLMYSVGSVSAVPVPAAVWLFGSGLVGLVGVARRRRQLAAQA